MGEDRPSLRAATSADGPAVRELVYSVLREYGLKPDPAHTDADLDDIDTTYHQRGGRLDLLVTPDGQIVGSVGLYAIDSATVELRKMYLHPSLRRQGHGKRLLDHALAQARRMGFSRMVLETAAVLKEAVTLYRQYGFRPYDAPHRSARCDATYELDLA